MRRFLVQTNGGGICMFDRAGAIKLRDSLPKHMQQPTVEVFSRSDVEALVADMQKTLKGMASNPWITHGERTVFWSAIADVQLWFKGVKG